jgi:C1A family cysteine protease
MLPERKIQHYGWKPDLPDPRDRLYDLEKVIAVDAALPKEFSLRSKLPSIVDQGQLGSCTANAIAGALETEALRQGEAGLALSRLFIYYGERVIEGTVPEDAGAEIRDGIKVVAHEGAPPETTWPYDIAAFAEKPSAAAYAEAKQHEAIQYLRVNPRGRGAPLRTAIHSGFAVAFGFSVPERFEGNWDPSSEVLPLPVGEGFIGGHATCAVGWDFTLERFKVPAFEIRNSWGSDWGDRGYFWMDARWLWRRDLSSDFWIIERAT